MDNKQNKSKFLETRKGRYKTSTRLRKWEQLASSGHIPEAIVAYIEYYDWVTIPRLMDAFELYTQTKGEYTLRVGYMPDVILWSGVDHEFCEILEELCRIGRIYSEPVSPNVFLEEGADLSRIAYKSDQDLSVPRIYWMPLALRPGKYSAPGQPGAVH